MSAGSGRRRARPERVWEALELELPPSAAEALFAAVGDACLGLESVAGSSGAEHWTAYFDEPSATAAAERRVRAALAGAALDPGACGLRRRIVADEHWAERYQQGLRPFDVGRRFTIDPCGAAASSTGRTSIRLVPGRAFGTGEHATTRLCIDALERHVCPGSRWVDLGCGSGILSVVAVRCGAREVLALDVDPEASEVAREVLQRNGADGTARVTIAGDLAPAGRGWDGIVCNISAGFLVAAAAEIGRALAPHGLLVASGWLESERHEVASALTRGAVLDELEVCTQEGWGVWVGGRSGEGA